MAYTLNNAHPYEGYFFETDKLFKPTVASYKIIQRDEHQTACPLIEGNIFPDPNSRAKDKLQIIIFRFKGSDSQYSWSFRGNLNNDFTFSGKLEFQRGSNIADENYTGKYTKSSNQIILSGSCFNGIETEYCLIALSKGKKFKRSESNVTEKNNKASKRNFSDRGIFRVEKLERKGARIFFRNELLKIYLLDKGEFFEFQAPIKEKPERLLNFAPRQLSDKLLIKILPLSRILQEASSIIEFDNSRERPMLRIEFIFAFSEIQKMKINQFRVLNYLVSELRREGIHANVNFNRIFFEGIIFKVEQSVSLSTNVAEEYRGIVKRIYDIYNKF